MNTTEIQTPYGILKKGSAEKLFTELLESCTQLHSGYIALSGGSTPKAFYDWVIKEKRDIGSFSDQVAWSVSDERCVPLFNDESNFGNADRLFLQYTNTLEKNKMPWPVDLEPIAAAEKFNQQWDTRFGADRCFDLCLLGMGEDAHTASIFPDSDLIESKITNNFAAIEVPGKGWRLTVTRAGLKRCGKILVLLGANKAEVVKTVFEAEYNPHQYPIQLLKESSQRVEWWLIE